MAKKSPFKSFSSILFAVFGSILFHSFGTSWLFIVRFKFIMVSAIKAPPISDWPYFRRICGIRYLFTNSLLPWRNKKGKHHILKSLRDTNIISERINLGKTNFFFGKVKTKKKPRNLFKILPVPYHIMVMVVSKCRDRTYSYR